MKHSARCRLLLLGALLSLSIPAVRAQTPPAPPSAGTSGEPQLSPAQKAKFDARAARMKKAMDALRADKKMTPAQKQARYVTLMQAYQADMISYLTPEQRAAAKKQQDILNARAVPAKALDQKIQKSLTAAQKSRIDAVRKTTRAAMEKVAADKSLSNEAKGQKMQALNKTAQDQTLAVMTAAQRADLEKLQQMVGALQQGQAPPK